MKVPRITTAVMDLTPYEWEAVRLAARAMWADQGDAVSIFLPTRPELVLRLDNHGDHYHLRPSGLEEVAEAVREAWEWRREAVGI